MMLAVVLGAFLSVPVAYGLEPDRARLSLDAPTDIELAFVDVRQLPFATDPEFVEIGVSCGMKGMCGEDPCLCGSADEWGACSCNGLQTVRPTFELAGADGIDVGFVRIVDAPWGPWLVSAGSGEADVVVTAQMARHVPASCVCHVRVAPFGPLDALKIAGALACAVLVVMGVAVCVRSVAISARAVVGRLRQKE